MATDEKQQRSRALEPTVELDEDLNQERELELERQALIALRETMDEQIRVLSGKERPTKDFTEMAISALHHKEYGQLRKSREQPYFARVTFREHGSAKFEDAYIGRFGVYDKRTLDPFVLDWRSPLANLYYDAGFNGVPVRVHQGDKTHELQFDVARKRQFEMSDGELVNFFDSTNAVRSNARLLERLNRRGEEKLRDIVETIQGEQNRIIRAEGGSTLIVQGAAGSGKTTIALHRLSYLAYLHKDMSFSAHFLIVAPNRLFIDYIADVLPDLGVEGAVQTTWEDLVRGSLTVKIRMTDHQAKIARFFEATGKEEKALAIAAKASRLRGSMAMKRLLDMFVERFIARLVPEGDFLLDAKHRYPRAEIVKKFDVDYQHYPYLERRKRLVQALTRWTRDQLKEVTDSLEKGVAKGRYQEVEESVAKVKQRYEMALEGYVKRLRTVDIADVYPKVAANPKNIAWMGRVAGMPCTQSEAEEIADHLQTAHASGAFEREDLPGLFYLTYRLHGLTKAKRYSHIVVDEVQDLSPFQIHALSLLAGHQSISLFGDLSQSIYPFTGLNDWDDLREEVLGGPTEFATLTQSYRSTVEIVSLANEVIANWDNPRKMIAEPVLRHGPRPMRQRVAESGQGPKALADWIARLQSEGLKHIALIDKTARHCKGLEKLLAQQGVHVPVITHKAARYEGGVNIVPIYLAKGMEFDAVILVNPTSEKFRADTPTDIKLLYVAMTRPLHRLVIVHWDDLTSLCSPESPWLIED